MNLTKFNYSIFNSKTLTDKQQLEHALADFEDYKSRIDQTKFKYVGFLTWLQEDRGVKGFSGGNLSNLRSSFRTWIGKAANGKLAIEVDSLDCVVKARKFVFEAKCYLDKQGKDEFSDKTWYFYFFYLSGRVTGEHPKLGRAILCTQKFGKCTFQNVGLADDPNSDDYIGDYKKLKDNKVLVFDLNSNGERNLHIKTPYKTNDDDIQVGSYNVFDGERLYSGTVILEQIRHDGADFSSKQEDDLDTELTAKLMSHIRNREDFDEVNSTILEFLSIKRYNYSLLPQAHRTLDSLQVFMDGYSPFKRIEERFLEGLKPRVFIASQTISKRTDGIEVQVDGERLKKITSNLEEKLGSKYEFRSSYRVDKEMAKKYGIYKAQAAVSLENLKFIRNCRFCIFYFPAKKEISFFSVQIGWALSSTKHIIVVYKKGNISKRLEQFSDQKNKSGENAIFSIKKIGYDNLELEQEKIFDEIERFLEVNS